MGKKILKTTLLVKVIKFFAVFSLFLAATSVYTAERDMASLSISEASHKIKNLKKSLENTKGVKRGKIVKEIAELENIVLEKTLRSAKK